jgi:hypothetical protein
LLEALLAAQLRSLRSEQRSDQVVAIVLAHPSFPAVLSPTATHCQSDMDAQAPPSVVQGLVAMSACERNAG